jgi:hypothetical protein
MPHRLPPAPAYSARAVLGRMCERKARMMFIERESLQFSTIALRKYLGRCGDRRFDAVLESWADWSGLRSIVDNLGDTGGMDVRTWNDWE